MADWTGVEPESSPIAPLNATTFLARLRRLSDRAESLMLLRKAFAEHQPVTRQFLDILNQLHDRGVDFVIVEGVAAALHGGTRVTFDLDVVPSLRPASWEAAIDLLWSLGARPRIPETRERVRDVEMIRQWRRDKHMLALNFRTADGDVEVDLLVGESDRFGELEARAVNVVVDRRTFLVASIDDLIAMKQRAGRPQDLLDIAELQAVRRRLDDGPGS
jgi:hypothetical protein